jgi:tripartite-type tricarboxylate transporter receptor subunit TctC
MQHVPYKGTQPALTDCIGGQIECMFDTPSSMMPHVRAGKIRTLGISADKRLTAFPDVPTFTEGGIPFIGNSWSMILAPARTPARSACASMPRSRRSSRHRPCARSSTAWASSRGGNLEETLAFLKAEVDKAARIVRDANVRLEG